MNSDIIYKNIPNIISDYFAGSDGNIYSTKSGGFKKLSSSKCSKGKYSHLWLTPVNGSRKHFMVHVAVCSAFHGEKPKEDLQVRHLDGNSHNNVPSNLCWSDVKTNLADKILHGTDDNGLRNSRSKLDKEKLFVIRWLLGNTQLSHKQIADIVDESRAMISKVNNKSRYSRSEVEVMLSERKT